MQLDPAAFVLPVGRESAALRLCPTAKCPKIKSLSQPEAGRPKPHSPARFPWTVGRAKKMVDTNSNYLRPLGVTSLLVVLATGPVAHLSPVVSLSTAGSSTAVTLMHVGSGRLLRFDVGPTILENFVATETKVREALNQHTFKRDVLLQTIGPDGEVTGEYIRKSQFIFTDEGNRIEHVLYHPQSTIREMRITKEDIQDLAGAQLLGIDITESGKYKLSYLGREVIDSGEALIIEVTPRQEPDPRRMKERYFIGRIWIDPTLFQITKIKGVVEPHGKQRFAKFETWRERINSSFLFPSRTEADDTLQFPKQTVHYRIKVRYYDYQHFASKVTITELDPPVIKHP